MQKKGGNAAIDNALQTEFLKVKRLQLHSIAVVTTKYTIHGWIQVRKVFSLIYDMTLWGLWLEIFGTLEDIEREPVCSFAPPYRCISMQGKTGFWYLINLAYRQGSTNCGSQENITTFFGISLLLYSYCCTLRAVVEKSWCIVLQQVTDMSPRHASLRLNFCK